MKVNSLGKFQSQVIKLEQENIKLRDKLAKEQEKKQTARKKDKIFGRKY